MNLKKVKYLIYAICAALLVTIMLWYWLQSVVFFVIVIGLCAAGIAVNLAFWRCPYCGEHLDRGGKYCSHCGGYLEDLE